MSIEVGISKIYNFIKGDMSKLDLNNDGKITETETYYCLLDNANEWNNEDIEGESNDIIKNFWNRLNFNKCGENCVMLDNKEIDKFNNRIEVYEKFEQYFDEKIKTNIPNELINDNYDNKWFHEAKEILLGYVETFLKKGGKEGELEAFLQGTANDQSIYEKTGKYTNLEQYAMNKATFAVYTEQYIQTNICDNGYNGFGYVDLSKIVEEMSHKIGDVDINGNPQTISDVITLVQEKVGDYVNRASGTYEFKEEEKNDHISEFQTDVLVQKSQNEIKKINFEIRNADDGKDQALFDAAKAEYENEMKGTVNGEYNERLALTSNDIYNSPAFSLVKDLNEARTIPNSFWYNSVPSDVQFSIGDTAGYCLPTSFSVQTADGKTKWFPSDTALGSNLEFRSNNTNFVNVDPTSGAVTFKDNGNIEGPITVSIGVYVGGHLINNIPFNVTVKPTLHDQVISNMGNLHTEDGARDCVRIFGAVSIGDTTKMQDQNLTTLYNENATIELYNETDRGNLDSSNVDSRFRALLDGIRNALVNTGLNIGILDNAIGTIYKSWLENMEKGDGGSTFESDDNTEGDDHVRFADRMIKANPDKANKIVTAQDVDGVDHWVVVVSVRGLVDAIIQKYQELGGR